MKTFSKLILAGIVASSFIATAALAQDAIDPGHPRINEVDQRIDNQEQDVQRDVAAGKITPAQAARDDAHLNHIQNRIDKDEAAHGGHITRAEQHRLNRSLNHDKNRIHNQRVNDGTAPVPASR